jgi:hypothetical protein
MLRVMVPSKVIKITIKPTQGHNYKRDFRSVAATLSIMTSSKSVKASSVIMLRVMVPSKVIKITIKTTQGHNYKKDF